MCQSVVVAETRVVSELTCSKKKKSYGSTAVAGSPPFWELDRRDARPYRCAVS